MEELQIKGLKELDARLKKLPDVVQRRILGAATAAAARVVQKSAKSQAPAKTGRLKKNIVVRTKRTRTGTVSRVTLRTKGKGTDPKNAYYGRFVEFGTKKQAARPFLRPAFDSNVNQAIQTMRKKIAQRLEAEARKL